MRIQTNIPKKFNKLTLICLLCTPFSIFAANNVKVTFDTASDISFDTGEKGCLLQHEIESSKPLISLNLSAANNTPTTSSSIRLRNGYNQYGEVGTFVVKQDNSTYHAAGESLKLHIEAARLFKTDDWEAYDEVQTQAEEMDETADPRFQQLNINVDGLEFDEYAQNQRAVAPFNSSKMLTVSVSLQDFPITDSDAQELSYDEADFTFEGVCNVIILQAS